MTAISVNPVPVTPPILVLSASPFLTAGEYVDQGGPVPSDAPESVSGWHLLVENPAGSMIVTKQTFVAAPATGGETAPFPEPAIYVRYIVLLNAGTGGHTNNVTSWQQVPA